MIGHIVLLLTLLSTVFSDDERILHGTRAESSSYPFMVSVQKSQTVGKFVSSSKFCGGVIVSPSWVLTAAHCFTEKDDTDEFTIHAGTVNAYGFTDPFAQTRIITKIENHPGWDERMVNDIALLKLNQALNMTSKVQPIGLPSKSYEAQGTGIILGWGATNHAETKSSKLLLEAYISVSELSICKTRWPTLEGNQICLGANDQTNACFGDSGGPFIQIFNGKPTAIGVTSFGAMGCYEFEPVVYTKVSAYVDWIKDTISKL